MIKILTIVSGLDGGGVENILLNYYKNMDRDQVHIDFIVHSQHQGKLEKTFKEMGCQIYHVTPKTISLKKNIIDIYYIMKNNDYDIVHSRMNVKGVTHLITAWVCGIKVRMIHNHLAYRPKTRMMSIISFVAQITCKLFATHWLACSKDAAIEMFGKKAVNTNKVIILNNAIEANTFEFNPRKRKILRDEFNIHGKFVVGMVGRFHEQKNHEFMLKIFREILNRNAKAVLMLVGDGELHNQIYEKTSLLQLKNNVIFTGIRNDVPDILQGMDIFVLPTKYEGFGNVLIEAQAAGLKTFTSLEGVPKATKVTALIEYISLKKSAAYWAEKILGYSSGYKRVSQKECIKAAGFDIEDNAFFLQELYINAVKKISK